MEPRQLLRDALATQSCRMLVLSDPDSPSAECSKATFRPVVVSKRDVYQISRQVGTQVFHENLAPEAAAALAEKLLDADFRQAALFTIGADHALTRRPDGTVKVRTSPPSKADVSTESHNREKRHPIPENIPCDFLIAIGVMTREGKVRSDKYHKFRQINRYLELVDDVVPQLSNSTNGELPDQCLRIVDFGCGKSYLTFALYHWLVRVKGLPVSIVGLDLKADVIADCRRIVHELGWPDLVFQTGSIADFQSPYSVDMVVSLHACDTATDDALAQAVRWQSRVIFAVPCCQHELAAQIKAHELDALMRYGLLHERFSALATDALRAAVLEQHGYKTQLVEFVDLEHTPKNILIRAVRRSTGEHTHPDSREDFDRLKRILGIETCRLERLL